MSWVGSVAEVLFLAWLGSATVATGVVMTRWAVRTRLGLRGDSAAVDVELAFRAGVAAVCAAVVGLALIGARMEAEEILTIGWLTGWTTTGALELVPRASRSQAAIGVSAAAGLVAGVANLGV